jgi:hypothetical protein
VIAKRRATRAFSGSVRTLDQNDQITGTRKIATIA